MPTGSKGLFYRDGDFVDTLAAGQYVFWRDAGEYNVFLLDCRESVSDVAGQEIMTSDKVTLRVNGEPVVPDIDKGFARIKRTWKQGDTIELNLPMPIRRVLCNEKVKENNGRVALQRGPIVYCAEAADNGGQVAHIVLSNDAELRTEYRQDLLGGASIITGKVLGVQLSKDGKSRIADNVDFTAIPYYAWAHRGGGEMAVWLPAVQSPH